MQTCDVVGLCLSVLWLLLPQGLVYSLGQGLVVKPALRYAEGHRFSKGTAMLMCLCCSILGLGRVYATLTTSLTTMYSVFFWLVLSLGLMNTVISSTATRLALADEVGGVLGVLESTEKVSGLLGPALAGVLSRAHHMAPLAAVTACYTLAFALVWFGWAVVGTGRDTAVITSSSSSIKKKI